MKASTNFVKLNDGIINGDLEVIKSIQKKLLTYIRDIRVSVDFFHEIFFKQTYEDEVKLIHTQFVLHAIFNSVCQPLLFIGKLCESLRISLDNFENEEAKRKKIKLHEDKA